jgi:ferredoxin--NADP+ reductase
MEGVPYDERGGRFANDQGRIADGLYAVGWARRGPTGTIGTNRPDGYEVAEQVAAAMPPGSDGGKRGGEGLGALLGNRGVDATSFDDWRTIEAAEVAAARPGSPREKFVRHGDWLKILNR